MTDRLVERSVDSLLENELLTDFAAVLIVGPRGSGKSTSARRLCQHSLDLSIPSVRESVAADPDGVLALYDGRILIDEWQESPSVLGAVKRAVDAEPQRKGRFIITGSVRGTQTAKTWPGTGRLVRVDMSGFTQTELLGNADFNPIDFMFAGHRDWKPSTFERIDYIERLTQGRFPDVVGRSVRSRARWFDSYVDQLIERDAPAAKSLNGEATYNKKLAAVVDSCAARCAQELNLSATGRDAGVDRRTAESHLGLLEDLFVLRRVPAWHTKRLQRLNRSPKIHFLDAGMAAHLLHCDSESLMFDSRLFGQLLENFCAAELASHTQTAAWRTEIFHLRDRDGYEVDLVLESRGKVVGLEVKSSTKATRADAKGLIWLKDKLGDQFRFGAILYCGKIPFQIEENIWALPISALWQS